MYKNFNLDSECPQGWGSKGAMDFILNRLLVYRKGKEDPEVTKENFEGSHTYLWLLEAKSYAPTDYKQILDIYYAEEKEGLTGFVNALLRFDRDWFDIPPEE